MVFELAMKDYNTAMIANELNERGIPTPGKFRVQRNEKIAWNRKVTEEEWLLGYEELYGWYLEIMRIQVP